MWCAARATEQQILLDGMVKPELRTPEHLQEILECCSKDLAQATVEGRVYVVILDADRVNSAEQARAAGKAILMWCAARATEQQILLDGMVKPELRTPEHLQEILECWRAGWNTVS
jgi:hypothetical protein